MKMPMPNPVRFLLGLLLCLVAVTNVFAQDRHIAAGIDHNRFLDPDGNVWVCGENDYGQLGNGTNVGSLVPVQVHFPKP